MSDMTDRFPDMGASARLRERLAAPGATGWDKIQAFRQYSVERRDEIWAVDPTFVFPADPAEVEVSAETLARSSQRVRALLRERGDR